MIFSCDIKVIVHIQLTLIFVCLFIYFVGFACMYLSPLCHAETQRRQCIHGIVVTEGCKEPKPGPLQEQALLTAVPSLQFSYI